MSILCSSNLSVFLFIFRCAVIHHKTSNNFTFKRWYSYIHILVSKMLLFKHPINKKTLICMDIWNAIPHMPINFRKRGDNWRLRVYPLHYSARKIRSLIFMHLWNADIHMSTNFKEKSDDSDNFEYPKQ